MNPQLVLVLDLSIFHRCELSPNPAKNEPLIFYFACRSHYPSESMTIPMNHHWIVRFCFLWMDLGRVLWVLDLIFEIKSIVAVTLSWIMTVVVQLGLSSTNGPMYCKSSCFAFICRQLVFSPFVHYNSQWSDTRYLWNKSGWNQYFMMFEAGLIHRHQPIDTDIICSIPDTTYLPRMLPYRARYICFPHRRASTREFIAISKDLLWNKLKQIWKGEIINNTRQKSQTNL